MCSATRLFTFFAVVVGFFAVIFTVDIFKPYRQNIIDVIPGYVNDTFTNYYDVKRLTKVFTQEELGNYSEHRELYSNMDMRIEYTIFLMMRLKSFRPEIDKKLAAPERMPKMK